MSATIKGSDSQFVWTVLLVVAVLFLSYATGVVSADGSTFTVDSTADASDANTGDGLCDDGSGSCTLRAAIEEANASSSLDTISFNIPGPGPHTIRPTSSFATITEPVIINGFTQPGSASNSNSTTLGINANVMIELDGSNAGAGSDGLRLMSGSSTVKGLAVNGFDSNGIVLGSKGGNRLEGSFIGTNPTGTAAKANGGHGVLISGTSNNIIGGVLNQSRNLISGNNVVGVAIVGFAASENRVEGNYIGTDVSGTQALPNGGFGIEIWSGADNIIGGTSTAGRNVISGNSRDGIGIHVGATGNQIIGNAIGLDAALTTTVANASIGVYIHPGTNNTVRGNFLRGNLGGVALAGSSEGNVIVGNMIEGFSSYGVRIDRGAANNFIGGTSTTDGNSISFNGGPGVLIAGDGEFLGAGSGNSVLSNSIFSNGGLGIDLGDVAATSNDVGDFDSGPNNLQNYPVVVSAVIDQSGDLVIQYSVDSSPVSSTYPLLVQFFEADAGDEEGQTLLGSDTYPSASAQTLRVVNLGNAGSKGITGGDVIVATATDDDGNTSEFSPGGGIIVGVVPIPGLTPVGIVALTVLFGAALLYRHRVGDPGAPT